MHLHGRANDGFGDVIDIHSPHEFIVDVEVRYLAGLGLRASAVAEHRISLITAENAEHAEEKVMVIRYRLLDRNAAGVGLQDYAG